MDFYNFATEINTLIFANTMQRLNTVITNMLMKLDGLLLVLKLRIRTSNIRAHMDWKDSRTTQIPSTSLLFICYFYFSLIHMALFPSCKLRLLIWFLCEKFWNPNGGMSCMCVCMFTITQRKDKVIFKVTNSGIQKLSSIKIRVISDFKWHQHS